MEKYHINCRGCHKPDKDTLIGKEEDCRWCDGSGTFEDEWCQECEGRGKREYIPKTSEHYWARTDAYNIYTGLYCDDCYKKNYPYKKDRYFDEGYCGERMEADY